MPAGAPRPIDWVAIYRRLMHGESHYRRWEIDAMTMPELALAMDDDLEKPRGPSYADASGDDVEAYIERRRRMTAWERLQEAAQR